MKAEQASTRDAKRASESSSRSSTARMADTLAAINRAAHANPMANPFLNRDRAIAIRATLAGQSGAQALNTRVWIADELLKAGETREAIAELQKLIAETKTSAESISAQKKPLFDLLAIAYLRLGEQENCLGNPAADVCILPLEGGGRHAKQEGARAAIETYTQILRSFPDDYGSRYLLNIAWMAAGGYPDSVPPRWLMRTLAPRGNETFPRFRNVAGDVGLAVTGVAGALSVEDFNGDGLLDLFITSWSLDGAPHLFLADGKGGYTDQTAKSGIANIVGGNNTVDADYDNDGDVDIFVLRGGWLGDAGSVPNSLLRNRGDATFEDVTFDAGLLSLHPTQTAAWADFDLDGWLDLAVGNESMPGSEGPSHPSELYRNNRDGTFTEVSRKVGIDLTGYIKAVAWGDVNNDGLPDLYASNLFGPNRLFVNRGGRTPEEWRFEERSALAGVDMSSPSFPTWFWDIDNDGAEDLIVFSYDLRLPLHDMVATEYLGLPRRVERDGKRLDFESSRVYRNTGDGTFEDVTRRVGLADKVLYAMGSNFGDLDNDGFLDFYVGTGNPDLRSIIPNRMFRNVDGRRFEEVTLPGGFGHLQKGHATAFVDLDRDGDEDVYMVLGGAFEGDRFTSVLFENPGWPGTMWIGLQLEGRTANRSAIGARVEIDAADATGAVRTIHRTVRTGGSFGAGTLTMHVGLGRATTVREVRVAWPDSTRSRSAYANLAPGRTYHIVQGSAPVALDRPPVPFRHGGATPNDHPAHEGHQ